MTRYDEVVARATGAGQLRDEFVEMFFGTLAEDAAMHRLWYDLRNQSLFDESFRADVLEIDGHREAMVWRVITRYAELRHTELTGSPAVAYTLLDGIFHRALLHHLTGMNENVAQLRAELSKVMDYLVTGPQ